MQLCQLCIIVILGKDVHVLITFIVLLETKADVHVPLIKSREPVQASHGSHLHPVDPPF